MKPYRNFLFILCALPVLAACSYFNATPGAPLETSSTVESIDLMAENPQYVQRDMYELIRNASGGSVQIFSLDNSAPSLAGQQLSAQSNQSFDEPLISTLETVGEVKEVAPAELALPGGYPILPAGAPYTPPGNPGVEIFSLDAENLPSSLLSDDDLLKEAIRQEEYSLHHPADGQVDKQKVIVYFAHDSKQIDAEGLQQIASLAQRHAATPAHALKVEGHASIKANYADEQQKRIVNLKVSMDRAFAVSRALIKRGVPAKSIRVMAWGDTKAPTILNGKTLQDAARRVEISG